MNWGLSAYLLAVTPTQSDHKGEKGNIAHSTYSHCTLQAVGNIVCNVLTTPICIAASLNQSTEEKKRLQGGEENHSKFSFENMEKFALTWKEYENVATGMFQSLFADKDFPDVTLVCADNNQTKSHKALLSACSEFFQEILSANNHQHPMIYLKGVKIDTLTKIMEFVYRGKTHVEQENLEAFLDAARDLKIKGLVGDTIEDVGDSEKESAESEIEDVKTGIEKTKEVKADAEHIDLVEEDGFKGEDLEQIDRRQKERAFACNRCHGNYTNATVLKRHLLAVHEGVKQHCIPCAKEFSCLDSLKRHKRASHDGVKYPCKKCGNSFTSATARRRHRDVKHTK